MANSAAVDSDNVPRIVLVVQPEFSFNTFVLITEALRIANQNTGARMFEWLVTAEVKRPLRATNGMWLSIERSVHEIEDADVLLVIGGNLPFQRISPKLLHTLRRFARHGTLIGGTNTGPFALAEAGLLDGYQITVHWETVPSFRERFPQIEPLNRLYVRDRDRVTCAGGVAALDMMLDLIGELRGRPLAIEIANAIAHHARDGGLPQRNAQHEFDSELSLAASMLRLMEANTETQLSAGALAARLHVNRRTMERASVRAFGETPMRLYLKVRLQVARNLLFYDELPMNKIALICGFSYPSVLSRAFKRYFHRSPQSFRQSFRKQQSQVIRPELTRLSAAEQVLSMASADGDAAERQAGDTAVNRWPWLPPGPPLAAGRRSRRPGRRAG